MSNNNKDRKLQIIDEIMSGKIELDDYKRKVIIENKITNFLNSIKCPNTIIFNFDNLPQQEIYNIHKKGSCFINVSYGEGVGLSTAYAAYYKNPVIFSLLRKYNKLSIFKKNSIEFYNYANLRNLMIFYPSLKLKQLLSERTSQYSQSKAMQMKYLKLLKIQIS